MASALPSKVLIFGATGTIGKYITGAILRAQSRGALPALASVAIFTSPATAASPAKQALLDAWRRQGLGVVTGDVRSAADVRRAYAGVDTVVSCLGRAALLEQVELLRLAEQSASVRWFLPSEYGTDIEYDATSAAEKPHQNKLKVRAFVRDELKRVQVTYVVTGPYADMFLEFKPGFELGGGFDATKHEAVLVGDGSDRIGFTTMPDVGKFVAAALAHPEASTGKALKVQSFVTTPQALLAEFEKQTGAKFDVKYTSKDQLREAEQKSWQEGNPGAALFTLRRIWAEGKTLYEKTDNETLQVSPGDLETVSDVVGRAVRGEGY